MARYVPDYNILSEHSKLCVILDSTTIESIPNESVPRVESVCAKFLYSLHATRTRLLNNM